MLGPVLEAGDTAVNRADKNSCPCAADILNNEHSKYTNYRVRQMVITALEKNKLGTVGVGMQFLLLLLFFSIYLFGCTGS